MQHGTAAARDCGSTGLRQHGTAAVGNGMGCGATYGRQRAGKCGSMGQALTELVLVLPFLSVLFMGALDLGRAFHTHVAVSNAARVGLVFAQQVASPRMLNCQPGTTCRFITVQDVINAVTQEPQGGIDTAHMQVNVCLQHIATCPVTTTSVAVASDEAITVWVSVPFQTITPFVHLSTISGLVSGRTFPFEPVAPTNTPGGATATATPTSTPPVTPTVTPTPQPIPTIVNGPSVSTCSTGCGNLNNTATVTWGTNQAFSGNTIWLAAQGSSQFTSYTASGGTSATITFTSRTGHGSAYALLPSGPYQYYVQSSSSGGSSYAPSCAPNCSGRDGNTYRSFTLP